MSNGLSQAEIDALLSGAAVPGTAEQEQGDNQIPEDVNIMTDTGDGVLAEAIEMIQEDPETKGMYSTDAEFFAGENSAVKLDEMLEPYEIDAMGEVGNISMGTAATTLFALLNRKVNITTPSVTATTMREIASKYPQPFVAVEVAYMRGLLGNNVLFLREKDVKIITDLLLGGDGTNIEGELSDLHLSAISEVMNQMMGSSATSLSKMINMPIDISPPTAYLVNLAEELPKGPLAADEPIIKNSFHMTVEGLIESEIMQIMPLGFCKALVNGLIEMQTRSAEPTPEAAPPPPPPPPPPQAAPPHAAPPQAAPAPQSAYSQQPAYSPPPPPAYSPPPQEQRYVDVKPAVLNTFEDEMSQMYGSDNIDLLMDVPLAVSVELGKSKKFIREILDFNVGSIIVLDKMAGEVVDIIVNGKLIAKGEVVVIDDNYGARITDIVSPSKRLNKN